MHECKCSSDGSAHAYEEDSVWVFGYGSLCWYPGFEYRESVLGHVTGFKRRFWQGNTTHRGTTYKPGRVATVVEEEKGVVWGKAFLVTGDAALPYLNQRECQLGGYSVRYGLFHPKTPVQSTTTAPPISKKEDLFTTNSHRAILRSYAGPFHHRPPSLGGNLSPFCMASRYFNSRCDYGLLSPSDSSCRPRTKPFIIAMFVATEGNQHWLGKAPLESIAEQITECHGPSGSNAEYLLNLAIFMRTEFPWAKDDHLFVLERLVREGLLARGQRTLIDGEALQGRDEVPATQQFTARLPSKQLRCLKI